MAVKGLKILSPPTYLVPPNDATPYLLTFSRQSMLTYCLVSQGESLILDLLQESI